MAYTGYSNTSKVIKNIQSQSRPNPTPVPTPTPFVGPGAGNYGKKDVYIAPGSSQSWINSVNTRANAYVPPTVSKTTTSGGGGGGSVSGASTQNYSAPAGSQIAENNINQQMESLGQIIDRDYETAMTNLQAQEDVYRQQAGVATSGIDTSAAKQKTALGNVQTQNIAGLAGEEATAQKSAKSSLQQARDLYRQVQQQNVAQLSSLGISSSSVTEALAEKLGVETAKRIAGVTGSLDEVMQNISKERTRVNTYYQDQLKNLEDSVAQAKNEIQSQLLSGIQQINAARNQAATEKANQRTTLWQNAQNALSVLEQNKQNFAQTLQLWNTQKTTSLAAAENTLKAQTTKMDALTKAGGAIQSIAGAGLTQTPQFLTDYLNEVYGTNLGSYPTAKKTNTNEEDLLNPF